MLDHRPQDRLRRPVAEHGRVAGQQQRAAAEVFDLQTQFRQGFAVVEGPGRLLGRQFHRFRHQQALHFERAGTDAPLELFKQNALVQGMLVDPSWLQRLLGIICVDYTGANHDLVQPLAESDADPLVRELAQSALVAV